MYCHSCGKEIVRENQFCVHCGAKQNHLINSAESIDRLNDGFNWSVLSIIATILLFAAYACLFLPWFHSKASASGFGQNISFNSGTFPGVFTTEGCIAFIFMSLSGIFLFKRRFWSYVYSIFALILAILLTTRIELTDFSFNNSIGSYSAGLKTDFGAYAFMASAFFYTVVTSIFVHKKQSKISGVHFTLLLGRFLSLYSAWWLTLNNVYFDFSNLIFCFHLALIALSIFLLYKTDFLYSFKFLLYFFCIWVVMQIYFSFYFQPSESVFTDSITITNSIFSPLIFFAFLSLLFYENSLKKKSTAPNKKVVNVLSPFSIPIVYIILLSVFFSFYSFTRHYVTDTEKRDFAEKNSDICGDWYFLSSDSTELYQLTIKLNIGSTYNNGELDFNYIASLQKNNSNIQTESFYSKQQYDFIQSTPIEFNSNIIVDKLIDNKLYLKARITEKDPGQNETQNTTIDLTSFEAIKDKDSFENILQYQSIIRQVEQLSDMVDRLTPDEFSENNYFNINKFWNGDSYQGEMYNNQRNGFGKYSFASGARHIGNWRDGEMNGKGTYYTNNDTIDYIGYYLNGLRQGLGFKLYPDGVYKGEFVNNQKSGKGKYIWNNGAVYLGEWSNDNMSGKGKLIETNGSTFIGNFADGKRIN